MSDQNTSLGIPRQLEMPSLSQWQCGLRDRFYRMATGFGAFVLMGSSFGASAATTEKIEFLRQQLEFPATPTATLFVDLDNDGRADLLATAAKKLWIYRQRSTGFTNAPDQVLDLPPQTAWLAPCDVDAHPGVELLLSMVSGLSYHRQNAGIFEPQRRLLIKAEQVFTNDDSPSLISLIP